jgi:putative ABC transport system ATP-binding protein
MPFARHLGKLPVEPRPSGRAVIEMVGILEFPTTRTSRVGSPVLAASDVTRRYGEGADAVDALRGVTLQVAKGELVALMGPSGSGKSTLLHILGGLDRPTRGEVFIDGNGLSRLGDDELTLLRRQAIGFVFQSFNLLPTLTVTGNVKLPLMLRGDPPDDAWVDELIERVGLTERRSHRPPELSGGEVQRVAIARALVTRPVAVLADEPTGNLDSRSGHQVLELLRSASTHYGHTIVLATHEPSVSALADRILILRDGVIDDELSGVSRDELIERLARRSATVSARGNSCSAVGSVTSPRA